MYNIRSSKRCRFLIPSTHFIDVKKATKKMKIPSTYYVKHQIHVYDKVGRSDLLTFF